MQVIAAVHDTPVPDQTHHAFHGEADTGARMGFGHRSCDQNIRFEHFLHDAGFIHLAAVRNGG